MRQTHPAFPGLVPIPVHAVVTEVNSRQHDLTVTRIDQSLHFGGDVLKRTAVQLRANVRNDAIAAAQQAAVLNLHVGSMSTGESIEPGWNVDHAEAGHQIGQFSLVFDDLHDARRVRTRAGRADGMGAGCYTISPRRRMTESTRP